MEKFRTLDTGVEKKASVVAIAVGVIGTLILGIGISLAMSDFGKILGFATFIVGIVIGLLGIAILGCASSFTKQPPWTVCVSRILTSTTALSAKLSKNKDMSVYANGRRHSYITNIFKCGRTWIGYPDVTLFPVLAQMFHVPIGVLFGKEMSFSVKGIGMK